MSGDGPVGVSVRGLGYRYRNATHALDDVHLDLTGARVALLGPNGAGKSTLLALLTGTRTIQEGSILIGGQDLATKKGRRAVRRMVGLVPQRMRLPGHFTCAEFIGWAGWMRGVPIAEPRVLDTLDLVGLAGRAGAKIKELSGGMRQRLCIAQALGHRPELLVVDEPTVGLDPQQRVRVRKVFADLSTQVLFATHLVDDVVALASEVVILDHGAVVFQGSVFQLSGGPVSVTAVERGYLKHVEAEAE